MSRVKVTFDGRQFDAMVKNLTGPEMKKAILGTLRSGANILRKETENQFHERVNLDGQRLRLDGLKRKYTNKRGKEVTKWKRLATVSVDRKEPSAKVHIMADFRTKFFEMGTKNRRTKGHKNVGYYRLSLGGRLYRKRSGKGGDRGRITAGWHFRKAQQLTERKIFESIDRQLSRRIIRISKKK